MTKIAPEEITFQQEILKIQDFLNIQQEIDFLQEKIGFPTGYQNDLGVFLKSFWNLNSY